MSSKSGHKVVPDLPDSAESVGARVRATLPDTGGSGCTVAVLAALLLVANTLCAQPVPPGIGLADPEPNFLIDLGEDLTTDECRRPSLMPVSVEEADREFPCRQMKITQHWLTPMLDDRAFRATPEELGSNANTLRCLSMHGLGDPACTTVLDDAALPADEETLGDVRRQAYFGRYWSSFGIANDELAFTCKNKKSDDLTTAEKATREAIEGFEKAIRAALPRLIALLVASEHPVGRYDNPDSDDWWWELPAAYQHIQDPEVRRAAMREDANEWIRRAGIWVLADAGTPQGVDECTIKGDYDFLLIQFAHLLYIFKGHEGYLDEDAIELLLRKGFPALVHPLHIAPDWLNSSIPFTGPEFDRELWYSERVAGGDFSLAETENHVLMTFAHYYLINQWIAEEFSALPPAQELAPEGADPDEWFAQADSELGDKLRDILSRTNFNGFFEDNARPYHGYTIRALLALASYARDDGIRTLAANALHFATAKYTFQSLEGRRFTPMRRNCEYVREYSLYNRDGLAETLNTLGGAYKLNDSPYGFSETLRDQNTCFENDQNGVPGVKKDCYWRFYTWKLDDSFGKGGELQDTHADQIPMIRADGTNEIEDDLSGRGLTHALYAAFSKYRIPRAMHNFMLKQHRYYARMMPKYQRDHYPVSLKNYSEIRRPGYFDGDVPFDNGQDVERTPEFYFSADGFLNVSGGIYNTFYDGLLNEVSSSGENSSYLIPRDPFPIGYSACNSKDDTHTHYSSDDELDTAYTDKDKSKQNIRIEPYDYFSRPYIVLPQVPVATAANPLDPDENNEPFVYYKPFGTWEVPNSNFQREQLSNTLPLMWGATKYPYRSTNVATYKNFSYGYGYTSGAGDQVGGAKKKDLDFPQHLPPEWNFDVDSDKRRDLSIGIARFRIYDFRELLEAKGQKGFYLITARVRKKAGTVWSRKVSRGFWEVVPGNAFASLDKLAERVQSLHSKNDFSSRYTGGNKHYSYRLAMTGELVRLSQFYGAHYVDYRVTNEGRVQGIIGIGSSQPAAPAYGKGDVFIEFMNNTTMNRLPLIDVKAVGRDYQYQRLENDAFVFYACAQNGWIAVNNPEDGSYFFADSRRGQFEEEPVQPTPYYEGGRFEDGTPWPVACGPGSGGSWTPSPPDNGVPEDCSTPEICDRPDDDPDRPSDDDDDPPGGGCRIPPVACATTSQCIAAAGGGICADFDANGIGECTCRTSEISDPDLQPHTVYGSGFTEGLPATGFCGPSPAAGGPSQFIRFRVRNNGLGDSDPTLARISWNHGQATDVAINAIQPGTSTLRSVDIPDGCYQGSSCRYRITVDPSHVLIETNEDNNTAQSLCLNPAG